MQFKKHSNMVVTTCLFAYLSSILYYKLCIVYQIYLDMILTN